MNENKHKNNEEKKVREKKEYPFIKDDGVDLSADSES